MKIVFNILLAAILVAVAPSRSFALWEIALVSQEEAKEQGIEVRSERVGAGRVRVEMELRVDGPLKDFSSVDLRIGEEDNPPVTAPLREDRSKPGRVTVGFTADRAQLDKLHLWIMVPGSLGGEIYDLHVKDFVK